MWCCKADVGQWWNLSASKLVGLFNICSLKLLNRIADIVKSITISPFELAYIPWCFSRQEEPVCRTISLCTGMQSSTLAGLLATQFLGSSHAVPAACSVVAMAIMGLTLASFWGNGSRIRDIPVLLSTQTCPDANTWEKGCSSWPWITARSKSKVSYRSRGRTLER